MDKEKIILPSDDEAASIQTVTGWVSRQGRFFGDDERLARYDGSTHKKCVCGEIVGRNSYCQECDNKRKREKFNKMEFIFWNGTDALYSQSKDEFFFNKDELDYFCFCNKATIEELDLVVCEAVYAGEINPFEYYYDGLPEYCCSVPCALQEAFDELNTRLREEKIILSWIPGKYRAIV